MLDTLVMMVVYVLLAICIVQMLYYFGTYIYDLVVEILYHVYRYYNKRKCRQSNIYYMRRRNRHQ